MRRSTLLPPIGMVLAACVLIGLMLLQPDVGSRAAPLGDISDYPPPTQTALVAQTQAALAQQQNEDPYPSGVATGTITGTVTRTPTRTPSSRTPTGTPDPNGFAEVTTSATAQGSGSSNAQVTATLENTPTPTFDPNNRVCAPGTTVAINGEGPANAGFLVYFDERVVSGGTVRRDGRFTVGLAIGNESGGSYPVEVRIRGTRTVLTKFTCQVPATTPTPIPQRIP